jgi:hypothetical protein
MFARHGVRSPLTDSAKAQLRAPWWMARLNALRQLARTSLVFSAANVPCDNTCQRKAQTNG